MWGEGTRHEFLPGPHVSPLRAGPPQEPPEEERPPGVEGPPEALLACSGPLPPSEGRLVIGYRHRFRWFLHLVHATPAGLVLPAAS